MHEFSNNNNSSNEFFSFITQLSSSYFSVQCFLLFFIIRISFIYCNLLTFKAETYYTCCVLHKFHWMVSYKEKVLSKFEKMFYTRHNFVVHMHMCIEICRCICNYCIMYSYEAWPFHQLLKHTIGGQTAIFTTNREIL